MSGYKLSKRSLTNLEGVHSDLVAVVKRAIEISPVDFTVIEGLRTVNRQKELVKSGASQTMRSRHLTGHAVDLVNIEGKKANWGGDKAQAIADAMQAAAKELSVPIEWGGNWRTFKDTPHFQLTWTAYPSSGRTK